MGLDFRREYEYQLSQREELRAALSTPISIVSVVGGVLGAMLLGVRGGSAYPEVVSFWILATVGVIVLIRAVYHLARSLHGHTYMLVGSPQALREHQRRLRAWHADHGNGHLAGDHEFDEYLAEAYAVATTYNERLNVYRGDQLFLGQRWMIRAAVATGLASAAFVVNQQLRPKQPERILVTAEPGVSGALAR
jgi:ABC-type nickel/cobalt efflux system permease component RcnA